MDTLDLDSYRLGAKAMFDWFQYRAANNWHANPAQDKIRADENEIALDWIEDAFEGVSPEHKATWKDITKLLMEKRELEAKLAELQRDADRFNYLMKNAGHAQRLFEDCETKNELREAIDAAIAKQIGEAN